MEMPDYKRNYHKKQVIKIPHLVQNTLHLSKGVSKKNN